jgi:hypothetical protein
MTCWVGSRKKPKPRVTPRIGGRADGNMEVIGGSNAAHALDPTLRREGAIPRMGEASNRRSPAQLVATYWKGAKDNGHITEEPRAWKARTRGSEAEVGRAIRPSTVTGATSTSVSG